VNLPITYLVTGVVGVGSRQARRPTLKSGCVLIAILSLLCFAISPARASYGPRVVVIVADRITYSDFVQLPPKTWSSSMALGLMSVGLESKPDPIANVYAALGAGDSVHVGDISEGRLCTGLHAAGKRVALIESGGGDALHMIPLADVMMPAIGGTVPLVTSQEHPHMPFRESIADAVVSALDLCDVVIAHVETALLSGEIRDISYAVVRRGHKTRIYVVGATPPPGWDRLTPVAIEDIDTALPVTGILTSTTTHTPGLIAARDIAPSILDYVGVPIPIQMTGAPIEVRTASRVDRDRILDHLDRVTYLDQRAQSPFFWGLGLFGGLVIFTCVGLTVRGKPVGNPVVLYMLRVLSSWPLALLVVWVFDPHSMPSYLAWIGAVCLVTALFPSPPVIFWVTSVVIIVDAFFGSRLVSQAVMSAYMMSGIRFYGIGNEYMGILIGGALMTPIVFARAFKIRQGTSTEGSGPLRPQSWGSRTNSAVSVRFSFGLLAAFLALTVFVLSFPSFGAKAGGAVTATATFMFLWWELHGRKITLWRSIAAVAIGFGLVFVWAIAGRVLHLTPTHIDTAVGAMSHGRFGYILGVAERKVGLALAVSLNPGTVAGVIGLIVLGAGTRILMRDRLQSLWERRPDYRAVVAAGFRGCIVALLFNDSGIVAAILLTISLMLPVLYNIFKEPTPPRPSAPLPKREGEESGNPTNSGAVGEA